MQLCTQDRGMSGVKRLRVQRRVQVSQMPNGFRAERAGDGSRADGDKDLFFKDWWGMLIWRCL